MGIVTLVPYVNGNDVDADGQNSNENAIVTELNGNLDNTNVKALAGIEGTKIAAAPNGIPTDRINDKAVTDAKLANDAASDGLRAVGANHIKNDAVIARSLKTTTAVWTPGGVLNSLTVLGHDTGLGATVKPLALYWEASGAVLGSGTIQINAIIAWHTGANTWHIYLANPTASNLSLAGVSWKLLYIPAS